MDEMLEFADEKIQFLWRSLDQFWRRIWRSLAQIWHRFDQSLLRCEQGHCSDNYLT